MPLKINEWETSRKEIGDAYYLIEDGRFHAILETKKGTYRGDHIHPNRQHTILLSGKASYYVQKQDDRIKTPLAIGDKFIVEPKTPHILIPETDIVTFEWWEGEFISEPCMKLFEDLKPYQSKK